MRRTAWLTGAVLLSALAVASAQPVDVPALAKLIEKQPGGVDRATWKEQRRDAARKLAASRDKRAVPVLIRLAETETFDIIGEIAIEGLGNLGDPSAAPVLQKIANDPTRDKVARDLAKKAIAKLLAAGAPPAGDASDGATADTAAPDEAGAAPGDTASDAPGAHAVVDEGTTVGSSNTLLGEPRVAGAIPEGPALPDDTLAAYDRLTFAIGTAALSYDTVRDRPAFDVDVAGRWQKRVDRERMAWGLDAGAHVVAGFIDPDGEEQTRGAQVTLDGGGEVRFYSGKLYGVGKAVIGAQLNYLAVTEDDGDRFKDTRTHADVQIALGGGYGRVLDVGGAIRVRRLARTLEAARALGKPIDAATARRLQLAWWGLRGERSTYRALVATVAILREAGVLLGEPDAGLSYELLTVLRDTQLYVRPSGLDIQVAFGEGYLLRPDDDPTPFEDGRVEQLLVTAGYAEQLQDDKAELSGIAYARMRLFAPETQPSPWLVGATGRFRRFAYGEHGDPLGALDVAASVRLSNDGCVGTDCESALALRIEGQLGYTMWLNQASGLRLAGTVAQDGGELFFGAELSATFGLLDGTYAGI